MFYAALTHDIDRIRKTYQVFTHTLKSAKAGSLKGVAYHLSTIANRDVFWGFDSIIEIEQEANVKSTHFFLDESVQFRLFKKSTWQLALGRYNIHEQKITDIIQWLDKNGWEIGVHGSYFSYQSKELMSKEKQRIEEIAGHKIAGIRQHYLNLNSNTWAIQKECGFHYDASFGHTNDIGFKDEKITPFHPFNDSFTVFPLPVMDNCFMVKKDNWKILEKILSDASNAGGVVVYNWHNNVYDEKGYPGFKSAYKEIIKISKEMGAEFLTLGEIYNRLQQEKK